MLKDCHPDVKQMNVTWNVLEHILNVKKNIES